MHGKTSSTLWGPELLAVPRMSSDTIEVSVHTLPRPLLREFQHVFDERNLQLDHIDNETAEFLAIPTNQPAKEDLVAVGEHIEKEKDRLLNRFIDFAEDFRRKLQDRGPYWIDYIDPCSGLPMLTLNCNKVYSEVDGMEALLGYRSYNAGFCKVLTHPRFSSAVYPATLFAYAPRTVVLEIAESYRKA